MIRLTRGLFSLALKTVGVDCVCDIGSRDGDDSLFFRNLLPDAVVLAFEPNPINYQIMAARLELRTNHIEVFPYAISSRNGRARFYVTDVDYTDAENEAVRQQHQIPLTEDVQKIMMGTSSLLVHEGLKVRQTVEVETYRIDEFILSRYPSVNQVGLWIDVEGAEYAVIEGITRIKERVVALHVETARTPMRIGQKTTDELLPLLASLGFVPCGSNMRPTATAGDVVFLSESTIEALGWKLSALRLIDPIAVFLQNQVPWLYHSLRTVYSRYVM